MESNKPLVIVLSRSYSTGLGVVRSLGAAGYTVDLLSSAPRAGVSNIVASSKYIRNHEEVISKKVKNLAYDPFLDKLLERAGKDETKPVLFPADDYTTSVIDRNRSKLQEHYIMPTIVGGGDCCLVEHMDKTFQSRIAQEAGLLVPREWIISLQEDQIHIPADMVYPCFCKPMESITGYKAEMARCCNEEELLDHLTKLKLKQPNRSFLVQEYLDIQGEIDLSGVCLDQQIIIPAIIRKQDVAQFERGVTLSGRVVPFEELGELQEKIREMLRKYRYFGMFDMELNIVDGKYYFNEINLRSGGPNYAYFCSGVNLPALFVKEALGQTHTPEEELVTQFGKSFVYEKVAWEDHIHGFMSRRELKRRLKNADILLLNNPDDPEPGKLFAREVRVMKLRWRAKSILLPVKAWLNQNIRPFLRMIKPWIQRQPQVFRKNHRNPDSPLPRVIVSGRNYCSNLCMARSLGQAGYEVEVLRIFQKMPPFYSPLRELKPDAYSRYIKAYHVCVTKRDSHQILDALIQIADPNRKMLLIPADDVVANAADEFYEELRPYYHLPHVNHTPGEINRLMSKEVQKELARAAGLPIVESTLVQTLNGDPIIPDSVHFPCFVKPNISKDSSKSQMRRCDTHKELAAHLKECGKTKNIEMLAEDFVDIRREYAILGLSTKDGVVMPGFFVTEQEGHGSRRGVSMTGRLLPADTHPELMEKIRAFVASLGFEGLFDVDLIEDASGRMIFTELNLRYGASGYAVTESGANLPGMFADYMLQGKPIDLNCHVTPGKTFISERVMLGEYKDGYINRSDMIRLMKESDIHFIRHKDDLHAYTHFRQSYLPAFLYRKVQQ